MPWLPPQDQDLPRRLFTYFDEYDSRNASVGVKGEWRKENHYCGVVSWSNSCWPGNL